MEATTEAVARIPTPPETETADAPTAPCRDCDEIKPIYAVGEIALEFSSLGAQREYELERAGLDHGAPSEQHHLYQVLSRCPHLARAMCWSLRVQGIDAYHLVPRTGKELDALVEAIRPEPGGAAAAVQVLVGWKGPVNSCAGLALPVLHVETSYSFELSALINTVAESLEVKKSEIDDFRTSSRQLFERIGQIADNMGELPEHRALNYLAVRFAPLYQTMASLAAKDYVLANVEARPSRLSGDVRKIEDVILTCQPRRGGAVEQYFVRVDVTDVYPHVLTTAMQPFFER